MPIHVDLPCNRFHLYNEKLSYIMEVTAYGELAHVYYGRKIQSTTLERQNPFLPRPYTANPADTKAEYSLDWLPQEFPTFGRSDFREPALEVERENGATVLHLVYDSYEIVQGKPRLEGLPHTYAEDDADAVTLMIQLIDHVTKLCVQLSYTIFEHHPVVVRSVAVVNRGSETLLLNRVLSMSIDVSDSQFDAIYLPGNWARERIMERQRLQGGNFSIESRRGTSSHHMNPLLVLAPPDTTEFLGDSFGFNLVYSGNFRAYADVSPWQTLRVAMGINPFDSRFRLESGEVFQAPEVVMCFSDEGLNGMSQGFHQFYQSHLIRGNWKRRSRPVLINNWEATYFDFNTDKLLEIGRRAAEVGIELFVLDDGWFGQRHDDTSSLGDWQVNEQKLPGGLKRLADGLQELGLEFGIWVEPEMISPNSDLYRAHPDWCLHVPDYPGSPSRNQFVLDLSRPDVVGWMKEWLTNLLNSAPISYVKWDMNRNLTEVGSAWQQADRQRETWHRYVLGLYDVLDHVTTLFPHVLFESCSGGGGRFDPGMLYYMPQTWTSDDTDAIARLKIQFGTTLCYPPSSMGAHVSAVPNHQVGRTTPLSTRGAVAMAGAFGYELDLTKLSTEELKTVKEQVEFYKGHREILQYGQFYRLRSPEDNHQDAAWMVVSPDKERAILTYVRVLEQPNPSLRHLRLAGLNQDFSYRISVDDEVLGIFAGDELMYAGLLMPVLMGDFQSKMFILQALL